MVIKWLMMVNYDILWLVLEPTPLKNDGMSSSVGMMIPNRMEKIVPNHQPDNLIIDGYILNLNLQAGAPQCPVM
jgi:hypothetical protein